MCVCVCVCVGGCTVSVGVHGIVHVAIYGCMHILMFQHGYKLVTII